MNILTSACSTFCLAIFVAFGLIACGVMGWLFSPLAALIVFLNNV